MRTGVTITICLVMLARLTFAHGDIHQRIRAITQKIQQYPDSAQLYLKRSDLYIEHMELDSALSDIQTAMKLNPGLHQAWWMYARLYYHAGDFTRALRYADTFLVLEPGHVIGLQTRAQIHEALGQWDKAAADYREILQRADRTFPANYTSLSRAVLMADSCNTAEAIAVLQQGIDRLGFVISLYAEVVHLLVDRGDYAVALQWVDEITGKLPRHEYWLYEKAKIYRLMKEDALALQTCLAAKSAIDKLPENLRQTPAMKALLTSIENEIDLLTSN